MPGFDKSKRQLVVAMDHGRALGAVAGLEDPGRVIEMVVEAGADAIMTSFGVIKRYRDRLIGRIPTLLRVDGGPSRYREDWLKYTEWSLLHTVDDARTLGVDGICCMVFMGGEVELASLEITAELAGECLEDGLTLMVEALPCPAERIPDPNDAQAMADACRLGFEYKLETCCMRYGPAPPGCHITYTVIFFIPVSGWNGSTDSKPFTPFCTFSM